MLGGNRFAVGMLAGLDAEGAIAVARQGGFDDEPLTSYRSSVQAQLDAFEVAGELDFVVRWAAPACCGGRPNCSTLISREATGTERCPTTRLASAELGPRCGLCSSWTGWECRPSTRSAKR